MSDTTDSVRESAARKAGGLQSFRVSIVDRNDAEASFVGQAGRCAIGVHPSNDLVLADSTVSRFHSEIELDPDGAKIHDCGSRNGTVVDGLRVLEAYLRDGSLIRVGKTVLRFELDPRSTFWLPASEAGCFGSLTGSSVAMRSLYAMLERAAESSATVLLTGETGTGKALAAESIHHASTRRNGPFVVVDCGALPVEQLEDAISGANDTTAFERAVNGTLLLDEIADVPIEMQAALLRLIESPPADMRLIAASNRNLRAEVNVGRFRPDLYFRLAVVHIELPPLRKRLEDIPALVEQLLDQLDADAESRVAISDPAHLARLQNSSWPGNVRELRNYLEQCLVFRQPPSAADAGAASDMTFPAARRRAVAEFERAYLERLMQRHGGKVQQAASAAGIGRVYLYKLLRKHGLHSPR